METAAPSSTRFRITGLPVDAFRPLFGLDDAELAARGARRMTMDEHPGFPDRIALVDAAIGETVLLVNHAHLPRPGPYRSSHAVFVVERDAVRYDAVDTVPDALRRRVLSLRAFDRHDDLRDADLVDGSDVERAIDRLFTDPHVAFIHVHYAKRGCYACRIDRAA